MRRILLLLTFCMVAAATWASKAFPGFTSVQQKDGTTLSIQLIGNAEFSYNVTTDGVILFHEGNDYFIASIGSNGEMISTGILAHNPGQRGAEETAAIKAQDTNKFYSYSEKEINRRRVNTMEDASPAYFPHTGTPKVLVILVQFQDEDGKFKDSNCNNVFNDYLNYLDGRPATEGNVTGTSVKNNLCSVRQYFKYCSYGNFEPQFDVYGPVTLSQNMAYYGAKTGSSNDAHVRDGVIPEACNLIHEQGVDFTQYDSNNDGYVDLVYVIYAGYGENYSGNSTDCIWPHVSKLGNDNTKYDGKIINRYGVSNELSFNPSSQYTNFINGIGVFCHEFSHGMGLPDIYPSNNMTKASLTCNQNMDNWDLMDGGEHLNAGYVPKTYLAWERERCGWMQIEELTNPASITMETINKGGKAYKIVNDNNPSEYIVLENIQKTGMDSYAPGHGMLAYRINEAVGLDLGYVNKTALSPAVAIVAADSLFMPDWFGKQKKVTVTETGYTVDGFTGTLNIDPILVQKYKNTIMQTTKTDNSGTAIYNHEAAGDPWPGTSNVTEMTGESYYAFSTVKSFMQNKPVTDIQEENGIISFKFKGGDVDGIINITDNGKPDNNYSDKVYTIDGRYLGKTTAGLRPGIYIRDGKKIVIRK